ncbi:GNAT family N-acetyltransferase [Myroides indicus]|uniref:Acetyltransferase (GNAT) family protein n=1 Tax=Myroides indicus TaxID=1323422 RepID=A0A4R7F8F4_9FLAO|nr:GNAT family N-acetyltransferase [Myroides indicus]TDS66249.1 hypothetical protein C8P70_101146 [Myroides indicus]
MLQIIPYTACYRKEWDYFVQSRAKNGTFLFERGFMEYHQHRFEEMSILIVDNNTIKAIFPANRDGSTVISHQGLTYGGLICDMGINLENYIQYFKLLLKYYSNLDIEEILIKDIPPIYSCVFSEEISYIAFLLNAHLYRRDVLSVIDLKRKLPFSENRRRMCRKASSKKYFVSETADFSSFWNSILIPRLKEKYNVNPVHTLNEIELLKQCFPNQIRQFNVYNTQCEIVGGVTVFETQKVAHLQYIAGKEQGNKDGALDFLQKKIIEDIFADKDFFDFGISNEDNGKTLNKGLLHWKEGFGARTVIQDFYAFKTSSFAKLDKVWK